MLEIVQSARRTAVKWKDKVSVLMTDETRRSKQGWNWNSGLYLKSNRSYSNFGQARNMTGLYLRDIFLIGTYRMHCKRIRIEAKRPIRGPMK